MADVTSSGRRVRSAQSQPQHGSTKVYGDGGEGQRSCQSFVEACTTRWYVRDAQVSQCCCAGARRPQPVRATSAYTGDLERGRVGLQAVITRKPHTRLFWNP